MGKVDSVVCGVCCLGGGTDRILNRTSDSTTADGTMSRIEILPRELQVSGKVNEVIAWLNDNVLRALDRKEILCEYCKAFGEWITKELIQRIHPPE